MRQPYPGLKYVPAKELDQSKMPFETFTVEDPASEKLGKFEGFIIDVDDAQPYYVVVNAGGWFRTKHVLIPIGHVALDSESGKLVGNVPKERVTHFPGFDLGIFPKLTKEDLDRMAGEIGRVCCPECAIEPVELVSEVETWAVHFRAPGWWDRDFYRPERLDEKSASLPGQKR